jgi:alpha-galactosidase
MPLTIAFTGAGSIGFTRTLVHDILAVPELRDTHFTFHDISPSNLEMVTQLCRRDIEANDLPASISATLDRRDAFAGADYVICTIRQGGLDAFALDIDIPLKYGVDQCVGDTLCAGGIMYAQRSIPAILEICADIRAVSKPGAILLNYSNPMAMNTWAANSYGGVRTIGLCHGVQGAHHQIARAIEMWAREQGAIGPDETVPVGDVHVLAAGINHQTWFLQAAWRRIDFIPKLLDLFERHPEFSRREKVRIDMLRRFGYYSTESNGHLSEYVPWYRKRPEELPDWIDMGTWIDGQTGGYLRVCIESRNWFETDFPNWMAEEPPAIGPDSRSEEHGSYIVEALETGRVYRGHFNVPNRGHITNLPDGCIVEIPGYVDRTGINMPVVGALPLPCAATCAASVRVQEMGMEAAVHGDVHLLKSAMLHDPLIGAVCNPEEVWQMTDELLVAQAEWLPQYVEELPEAARRLREAEIAGRRVAPRPTWTVTRKAPRTVDEMARHREEMRRISSAADKGTATAGKEAAR